MQDHYQLTDAEFEIQFSNCTLDPQIFNHEAHLRLAWLQLHHHGFDAAIQNTCQLLKNYTASVGAPGKYNHTLTIAALQVVFHFMQKKEISGFREFIKTYPRLKTNFKELLGQHYSFNIFSSGAAKANYINPDLNPFDRKAPLV
jgi:hypothetical protein